MTCQNCKNDNDNNSIFCKFCGIKIINISDANSQTNASNKNINAKPLPPPINHVNPLAKFNTFYIIAFVICMLIGLAMGNPIVGLLFFSIPGLIIFISRKIYSVSKLIQLRKSNFKLEKYVAEDKIIDYLNRTFYHQEIKLDFTHGISFIYNGQIMILVKLNKDNSTFNIDPRATFKQKMKNAGRTDGAKLYILTFQIVGSIVQVMQETVKAVNESN